METPLEEIHKPVIINPMIDDQLNHEAKDTKILMAHNQWNWMLCNNHNKTSNDYPLKRKSDESEKSFALHVESQDTCQGTVNSNNRVGHKDRHETTNKLNSALPQTEECMTQLE